ncbi:MAG: hypothetical protein ACR2HF_10155, partial [Methylococcaceae bacterium]
MNPNIFDTDTYATILKSGGFSDQQVDAQTRAFFEVHENLAKRDLAQMRSELTVDMEKIRSEMRLNINDSRKAATDETESSRKNIQRDIKEIELQIETARGDLKRDIKEQDTKIEVFRGEVQRDIESLRIDLKRDIL